MGCPGPSKSSSRAGESLIFMFFQFQLSTGTFGSTWSVLGASWAQLGASWAPLGLNLGALGTNLAPTWALLGPTWRQLGRCWNQVGTNLSPLWAIMGDLVTLLERSWSLLGASGPFKGDLGLILVPPRRILAHHRHDFDVYEALFWSLWRSFLVCNQRRHSTSKAHQATMTNHDSRKRNYNDDATTAQVGRGSRRFSGMFWKASWGFKQSLRRYLRGWKLSENCPITLREDSENQIQQRCTASSLQDLYRQDDWGRRSSRSELNPPAPRLRAAKCWTKTA